MKRKMSCPLYMKKEPKRTDTTLALLLSVVLSLTLAILSLGNLDPEDRITRGRGLVLFSFGVVFFVSLYNFLNHAVLRTATGHKIIKKYKLTTFDVLDTNNKIVSSVQALLACITGTMVCMYSCPRDLLHTSHHISEAYAWFGAAYFIYDIWAMYRGYCCTGAQSQANGDVKNKSGGKFFQFVKYNPIIVAHHVFIGSFGFFVITYLRKSLGDCVFGFVFLMEASTPFVSLRGIITRFGMKNTNFYVINGLVMVGTFFLCRIAMFPYIIYLYAKAAQLGYIAAILSLPNCCKLSICILLFPQIYWFVLMVRGATRALRPKKLTSVPTFRKKRSVINGRHA